MQKNLQAIRKFHFCSARNRMKFKNTFGSALRERLAPNTGLHPKVLADAIGCDVQSVYNHMNARNAPDGAFLQAYIAFFAGRGDESFIVEVFPGITPLIQRKHKADRAVKFMETLAEFAQGAAA